MNATGRVCRCLDAQLSAKTKEAATNEGSRLFENRQRLFLDALFQRLAWTEVGVVPCRNLDLLTR